GIRGWKEIQEGNTWVGTAMIVSAVFSVGAAIAFSGWAGTLIGVGLATGVGVVLVVLVIAIAVLIEIFKDNKVQDWMERCYFGTLEKAERFIDPALEMEELKIALEG